MSSQTPGTAPEEQRPDTRRPYVAPRLITESVASRTAKGNGSFEPPSTTNFLFGLPS